MTFQEFITAERARGCKYITAIYHPKHGIFTLGKDETIHCQLIGRVIGELNLGDTAWGEFISGFYEFETGTFYNRDETRKKLERDPETYRLRWDGLAPELMK